MAKNKLSKFADMKTYHNVFEYPFGRLEKEPFPYKGKWKEFFGNENPIILELGCGKGEYTIEMGEMYKDKNFIGVDIKGARMWSGATYANKNNMKNIAFLRTEVELIERFFDKNEVDEIWITFCDPQMKKATKRLTSSYFLKRYENILKADGIVHLKTDSPFLYTYTNEIVKANNLDVFCNIDDIYSNCSDDMKTVTGIKTYYEQQWLDRGLKIKYMSFSPKGVDAWVEPEIEIEPDGYRSFGRNRR